MQSDGRITKPGYALDVKTGFELWLEQEGLPVIGGFGVEDMAEAARAPWARMGGKGAYIRFEGMEGYTSMYAAEIPGGGALNPEKHLYEEVIYVLRGRGSTEVWQGKTNARQTFEWGKGSLFAVPVNAWHRMFNGSSEPAVFMAVTNAPMLFDVFFNPDFILNCDYEFRDRFDGRPDYFSSEGTRYDMGISHIWDTNLIPDVQSAHLVPSRTGKIAGGHNFLCYELAGNTLIGHINELPLGKYHKAHHHGGGAILQILRGEGYCLLWPEQVGTKPFQSGHGDSVQRVDFKVGGAYCPPSGWFHAHYNTGPENVRQLAFRYHGMKHPIECWPAGRDHRNLLPIREGGTLIESEDEDPEIRRRWEEEIRAKGIQSQMPAVAYR